MVSSPTSVPLVMLASAAEGLLWQDWGDEYIVYQISSAETHVFNETTALILERLKQGPASLEEIGEWIVTDLGIEGYELSIADLVSAAGRLDELGLIDCRDGIAPCP